MRELQNLLPDRKVDESIPAPLPRLMDTIERQREAVARHIRGENEHDWAAVYATFVQDDRAHYDVMPLSASRRRRFLSMTSCTTTSAAIPFQYTSLFAFGSVRWFFVDN
jgi:hypothetical protein